jgi:hypothetical protein
MLENPAEHEKDFGSAKLTAICRQVSPDSLKCVSAGIYQRAVMDESEMFSSQMETHNRS